MDFYYIYVKLSEMNDIVINPTNRTPEIRLETRGYIKIAGRSIPEDPGVFYEPLYLWVYEYCLNPQPHTVIDIDLEYFNSGTFKCLLYILRQFVDVKNKGRKLTINWHYEEDDDDIRERGEYFESILEIKVNMVVKPATE